ncbi:recombinase family protein, partial [Vibrio parahaemolyticus]
MSTRTYFYCRVSTTEQTTANQIQAFKDRGYEVNEAFVVEDVVSGGVCALERKGFRILIEHKLVAGDTLVVLKLDRLGRDNIDVQQTIKLLMDKGINIHCLDLPHNDLNSPEG